MEPPCRSEAPRRVSRRRVTTTRARLRSCRACSDAASGSNKTLNRSGQHEQIRLTVRGMLLENLVVGDQRPGLVQQGIPLVRGMRTTGALHLDPGVDDVGLSATDQRVAVVPPLRIFVIVGAQQALQPMLERPVVRAD